MRKSTGFFRYLTFGLRKEWVELFFKFQGNVLKSSLLGPVQIDALYFYLNDMELLEGKEKTTIFYQNILFFYEKEGIDSLKLWSLLWVNLCFNAPLFRWCSELPLEKYTREKVIELLAFDYGKKNRSISNAYTALIGTLERTPIGSGLRLGRVIKDGGARLIIKEGGYNFPPLVVLYALYKYAERFGEYRIVPDNIAGSPFSPQTILAISSEAVKDALLALFEPDFLTVDRHGERVTFRLNERKNRFDVLKLCG